jgi:hypothetical protein
MFLFQVIILLTNFVEHCPVSYKAMFYCHKIKTYINIKQKIMKKLLITLAFCGIVLGISAQGMFFGPQVGFSSTTLIEKGPFGNTEKKLNIGYQIGVAGEIEIMNFLYVGASVSFFQKGDKQGDETFTAKTKLGYLDVPITLGYKMPIGNVSVFGNVGPYTSIAIVGKSVYHTEFMDETHEIDFEYYKRFDTGVTFGGGVEFKQFQVKANYSLGFVNVYDSEIVTAKNSVFNITGTYFIGRNY